MLRLACVAFRHHTSWVAGFSRDPGFDTRCEVPHTARGRIATQRAYTHLHSSRYTAVARSDAARGLHLVRNMVS
jgi:hypothetical protein